MISLIINSWYCTDEITPNISPAHDDHLWNLSVSIGVRIHVVLCSKHIVLVQYGVN